jgi:hypothetical protein
MRHRVGLLTAAIAVMAATATLGMIKAVTIIVSGSSDGDVVSFFSELVPRWFAGLPVYSYSDHAVHLPATYALLWPIFGVLHAGAARWVWIALLFAALACLIYLTLRASGASSAAERIFVVLQPLSMYGVLFTIRTGQFGVFVLVLLIAGLSLLAAQPPSWKRDLIAAALLLLTLVKPTIAAPFIWLALFLPGGFRTVLLIALGYAALTIAAVTFQPEDISTLFREWQMRSAELATSEGTANLHRWLSYLGLDQWILPASLAMLLAFGAWVYRNRGADLWLLLGVAALFARFWTYHRPYDDLLMLLPAVALFRSAKQSIPDSAAGLVAGVLLALLVTASLTPMRFLVAWRFHLLTTTVIAVLWCATLVFLARQAHRDKRRVAGDRRRELATESIA